jgi:C4-dicarboxylate-binding protein DctP
VADDEDAEFRKKVIADNKGKVTPLNAEQLKAWRMAMQPVWKQFEGEIGADLIQAAQKANK